MSEVEQTQYGFKWGPLEITRVASDERHGNAISVATEYEILYVRASAKGRKLEIERRVSRAKASA